MIEEETANPEVFYGAMEGGHVVTVTHFEDIGCQAALVLAERESKLTGWQFKTNGIRNSRGQFVWILVRSDQSADSEGPDWKTLTKGIENVQ